MRIGHYHLAVVRLERLLKEYPESSHYQEMLTMIVNAYVLTQREEKAVTHLRTLLHKFPGASATLSPKLLKLVPPEPPPTQPDVPAPVQVSSPSLPVPVMDNRSSAAAPPGPSTAFAGSTLVTVQNPADQSSATPVPTTQLENNTMVMNRTIRTPASGEAHTGEALPDQSIQKQPIRLEVTSIAATPPPDEDNEPSAPAVQLTPVLQTELPTIEHHNPPASVDSKMPATDTAPLSTTIQTSPVTVPPPALSVAVSDSAEISGKGDHILVLGDTVHRHKMTVLLKRLRAAGLNPTVSKGKRSVVMHRLVSACFDKSLPAVKRQRELAGFGTKAFIFREGNSVCAAAGSFVDVENADRVRKHLAKKGIATHIVESKMVLRTWRITSDKFPDILTAEEAMRRLALKGIEAAVEPL
jgi:hypothetical protein